MANAPISANTAEKIRAKAETNTPLMDATPEKQQMYDAYQAQYKDKITQKAQSGEALLRSNAWKDEIYQGAVAQQYTPEAIMGRQQDGNAERLSALEGMLQKGADSTYNSQKAILDAALNKQLTDLQMQLEEAVANGEISLREAHAAFEDNKAEIEKQAYQDSEMTNLNAQSRGIQNSQQMIGLQQGDNARRDSLINKNMTERDRRVADVKDRLNMIKSQSKTQMSSAQAQHGYGLAGAKGQADSQMYQNMFNLGLNEHNVSRDQQFQLDKTKMDHTNQQGMQAQQQKYAIEQLDHQQKNTLQQFAVQNGYDLNKMSIGQQYQLAQMGVQHGFDLKKMQEAFGYDAALQGSQQAFQGGQNALDRQQQLNMQSNSFAHDQTMFSAKQTADSNAMKQAMETELSSYTDKNSTAYKLREAQLQSSIDALHLESNAKIMADIGGKWLVDKVGSAPVHPGTKATKSQIDAYNGKVETYNDSMTEFLNSPGNMDKFLLKVDNGPYADKQKSSIKSFFSDFWNAGKGMNPGGLPR